MDNVANLRPKAEQHPRPHSGLRPPPRRNVFARKPRNKGEIGERLTARDGKALVLRQIHADDTEALQRFFGRLTPLEVRMRFLHPMNEMPEPFARQLCELDPGCAVAWVLGEPDDAPRAEIYGVARIYVDKTLEQAEFGIVVQGRFARQGFGTLLMRRAIESARKLGAVEVWSNVLIENEPMLGLCESLGFTRSMPPHDPGILRVSLALT